MVSLECRMYENIYPEPDDIVMALVTDIQEMGAYVKLLEYNNCQGMIMLSELSRRRIRSVNRLLRVGKKEVVAVVRVDKDKGYIDLSKRRVTPEDIVAMDDKFNKGKTVHSIMRHVAGTVNVDMEDLYVRWGWPLYRKYGHAYDGFRQAVMDPDAVLDGLDITDQEREELLKNVRGRLTAQAIKFRANFEVTCHTFEGIDAIKEALSAAEKSSPPESPVKIKIIAAPLYIMNTTSLHKTQGIKALNDALEIVNTEISKKGGRFILKAAPRTVSEKDEKQLSNLMEEAENENREDDDDDEDDESEESEEEEEGGHAKENGKGGNDEAKEEA